jgi:hypothetical protein
MFLKMHHFLLFSICLVPSTVDLAIVLAKKKKLISLVSTYLKAYLPGYTKELANRFNAVNSDGLEFDSISNEIGFRNKTCFYQTFKNF